MRLDKGLQKVIITCHFGSQCRISKSDKVQDFLLIIQYAHKPPMRKSSDIKDGKIRVNLS